MTTSVTPPKIGEQGKLTQFEDLIRKHCWGLLAAIEMKAGIPNERSMLASRYRKHLKQQGLAVPK